MTDAFTVGPAALTACTATLDAVDAADLARSTPCVELPIAGVIDHLHLAMVRLAALAGSELSPTDPLPELAVAALGAWRERGLDGTVQLRGALPARRAADLVPLELVVHGWDVATALGRSFVIDDDVVTHLLDAAHDIIPNRRGKAFGAEVVAPTGASPLQKLIAFTGRRPVRS